MDKQHLTKLDRANTSFTLQLFEHLKKAKFDTKYGFLKYYQNIVREYVTNIAVDARGLLIYHTMGMGKSILAITIALELIKERQVIFLLTKSLQENMRGSIFKYVKLRAAVEPEYFLAQYSPTELNNWIDRNFSFVSMNASNMLKQLSKAAEAHSVDEFDAVMDQNIGEIVKMVSLDGKLLIVDEAHNLFRAITNGSKNAHGFYAAVMKAKNLKAFFLTGTPIASDPFELVPCFNMLGSMRPEAQTLPEDYRDFDRLFIDRKNMRIMNREKFQNRILGLVSYVSAKSEPGKGAGVNIDDAARAEFPEQLPVEVIRVHMDADQYVMYGLARDKEKEEGTSGRGARKETPSMTKPKSGAASTYRVKSRQLSNFCAPAGHRDEKDPAMIPESALDSAKFREIESILDARRGQLGLIYSQFTGVGGLGTLARYLIKCGWKQITVGTSSVQGGDDMGDDMGNDVGDMMRNDGKHATNIFGSGLPTVDDYLQQLESIPSDPHSWWLGGEDTEVDTHNDTPDVEFKYATPTDAAILKKINPSYVHMDANMQHPRYIMIVIENGQSTGYVQIEYVMKTVEGNHGQTTICMGRMVSAHMTDVTVDPTIIFAKITEDAQKCATNNDEFNLDIWGDITSAVVGGVEPSHPQRYFASITGEVDPLDRTKLQDMYNDEANKHGGALDLLLISSTGAEGLDLKNGRFVIAMEPYWGYGRFKQVISRLVRNDSHIAMSTDEKNVTPYILLAIPPESEQMPDGTYIETTDTELYDESLLDQVLIESYETAIQEVSIECMINGESNCRMCNPTNMQLFTDNIFRDISAHDPCSALKEENVLAEEVLVDGVKYYFTHDPTSIYDYRIFEFDKEIDGYRPMKESNQLYAKIVAEIERVAKSTAKGTTAEPKEKIIPAAVSVL